MSDLNTMKEVTRFVDENKIKYIMRNLSDFEIGFLLSELYETRRLTYTKFKYRGYTLWSENAGTDFNDMTNDLEGGGVWVMDLCDYSTADHLSYDSITDAINAVEEDIKKKKLEKKN